jgi:glycosyltransferase involved in cell wall biosynthesis
MEVTVVVSTRDRGELILPAVQSLLRDQDCDWEVVLVDQSATEASRIALDESGALADPRLVYLRSESAGVCRGRNEALRHARGEIVAITDDDCTVPPRWAADHLARFKALPEASLVYAPVIASPGHDNGWVPEFLPLNEGPVRLSPDIIRSIGLTSNCALRSSALTAVGFLDEFLGPGAVFGGGDDTDFGYRAVRAGLGVYTFGAPAVSHNALPGVRNQYVKGLVAMCMKHVRCGDAAMLRPVFTELRKWTGQAFGNALRARRPSGLRPALGVLRGAFGSFRYGVDRWRRLYRPWFAS